MTDPVTTRCTTCSLFSQDRPPVYPKYATKKTTYVIVGEAPGNVELERGEPFVGPAGQLLKDLLGRAGIDVKDCTFTNACWCAPEEEGGKGIRTPSSEESGYCSFHAFEVIREVKPKIVIATGKVAYQALSGRTDYKLSKHGIVFTSDPPFESIYEDYKEWVLQLPEEHFKRWRTLYDLTSNVEEAKKQVEAARSEIGYKSTFDSTVFIVTMHPSYILRQGDKGGMGTYSELAINDFKAAVVLSGRSGVPVGDYRWITEIKDWESYVNETINLYREKKIEFIALDVETTECEKAGHIAYDMNSRILTIQFSRFDNEAVAVMVNHKESKFNDPASFRAFRHILKRLLDEIPVVGQNIAFDYNVIRCKLGLTFKVVGDTMLLDHWHMMGKGVSHGLDELGARYLGTGFHKTRMKQWVNEHPGLGFEDCPLDIALSYSAGDASITRGVFIHLRKLVSEEDRWDQYYSLYFGVHDVWQLVADMNYYGMPVDTAVLSKMNAIYPQRIKECVDEMLRSPFVIECMRVALETHNKETEEYNKSIPAGSRKKKRPILTYEEWVSSEKNRWNPGSWQQVLILWRDVMKIPFFMMPDIEYSDSCPSCRRVACRCYRNKYINTNPKTDSFNRKIMADCLTKWAEVQSKALEAYTRDEPNNSLAISQAENNSKTWVALAEFVKLQTKHKDLEKLYGTYVESIPSLLPDSPKAEEPQDPRERAFHLYREYCAFPSPVTLHPSYHLHGTETGRTSCSDPNIQQFTKGKSDKTADIKLMYPSRYFGKGGILVNPDLRQIEIRIAVCECGDTELAEAIDKGLDFHKFVTSKVYGVPVEDIGDKDPRRDRMKRITFGILYGMSTESMAADLHISDEEAEKIVDSYWAAMPKMKAWVASQEAFVRKNAFSTTRSGRRRWLDDINSEDRTRVSAAIRCAVNSPIQGTASDLCLSAMGRAWQDLKKAKVEAYPYSFIHDAQTFDCSPGSWFDTVEACYYEMAVYPRENYDWVICTTDAAFDVGVNWGMLCKATLLFEPDKNLEHDRVDFEGKTDNVLALVEAIEKGGDKVEVLKSAPTKEGEVGVSLRVQRKSPRILLHNRELLIV
jgi:uracil-DNA glycosylase family 4